MSFIHFHPLQITASAGQTLLNLDLSNCLSLTDQCCTSIARNCKVLEVLGLTNLKEIKGDNLCKFFQNEERARQFRAIMLSGSKNVRQSSCILYSQGFIQRWGSPGKSPPLQRFWQLHVYIQGYYSQLEILYKTLIVAWIKGSKDDQGWVLQLRVVPWEGLEHVSERL